MKKERVVSVFMIFGLCFLTHFIYTVLPSTLTAIFFPVNESIWEHMKMLFTTILLYHVLESIYLHIKEIKTNNFWLSAFVSALLSIPIYLIMFLPFYYSMGENMIITFIILFVTIAIVQCINYKILEMKEIPYGSILSFMAIIICYIIFIYLTYNPPKTDLFFDTEEEKYGINDYAI